MFQKFKKDDNEMCVWNFCFDLNLGVEKLELYSPTRVDRDKWVWIFNLLIQMNHRKISTRQMTPWEFVK